MSATPQTNGAAQTAGPTITETFTRPLAALAQVGAGQLATIDPTTGYAALNDGTVGYRLPAGMGFPSKLSSVDGTAGQATAEFWTGTEIGLTQSTESNDGFTDASMMVPWWIADENTPGALPVFDGDDRSIGGFVQGMMPGSTTIPRLATGPVAGVIGLLCHMLKNFTAGAIAYAVDATAATDLASAANPFIVPRGAVRGKITSVTIVPSATLAATSGNDAIITLVKVDTTGTVALASSPVVATFTTTTALAAGVAASFTLSGTAANLLFRTTDKLGWYRTHNGSGAVIPASSITPNFQVI